MKPIGAQYDALVRAHPRKTADAIRGLEEQLLSTGCKFGEKAIPTFLKPFFLSEEEACELDRITHGLIRILENVVKKYMDHRDIRRHFDLSKEARKLVEIDPGYAKSVIIARPDSFLTSEGIRFVELNCDSPAGMGYADIQEGIFCSGPIMKKLERRFQWLPSQRLEALLKALLACYREFGGGPKRPRIAVVDWKEMRTLEEFYITKRYFESKGYNTVVADPRELRLKSGRLEFRGRRIDLVYRRAIFDELLARRHEVGDFLKACGLGKVCVVNPLRSKLAASKALLSVLTNPAYDSWFSKEECEIRSRFIPWTRQVIDTKKVCEEKKGDLKNLMQQCRKRFVLKPSDSYGGKDVRIGDETSPKLWREVVNRAFREKERWVVQERVEIPMMTVPVLKNNSIRIVKKKVNLNPYILNGRYAGAIVRLSDESVINVSAGGGLIPVVTYRSRAGRSNIQ